MISRLVTGIPYNVGEIIMNTSGGSETYRHPLVNYDSPLAYYDSGWYAWFYDCTTPRESANKLIRPPVLNLSSGYSIQANWFQAYLKKADVVSTRNKLVSYAELKHRFCNPWPVKQYVTEIYESLNNNASWLFSPIRRTKKALMNFMGT